jgi:hypothetical protein
MNPFPDELDRIGQEIDELVQGSCGDFALICRAQSLAHKLYRHVLTREVQLRADTMARKLLPWLQAWYNHVMSDPERQKLHKPGDPPRHFAATWYYPDWLAAELYDGYEKYKESEARLARERGRSIDQHLAEGGSEPE